MFKQTIFLVVALLSANAHSSDTLQLGNDNWPPFVIDGDDTGIAEQLVCQALNLSGWACAVDVNEWDVVLGQAKSGAIDGIVASWKTSEREQFLLFSEPYLTNRIVPVVSDAAPLSIEGIEDLAGLRVALVTDYAYGEEILGGRAEFKVLDVADTEQALLAVQNQQADLALIDSLVARNEIDRTGITGLAVGNTVLAFRELHFAVSLKNPRAQEIIDGFHRAYQTMLQNGMVNEILNIDWIATDFGHAGNVDLVMRNGVSLDSLSHPSKEGSVYSLQAQQNPFGQSSKTDPERVKYQVRGESYSTLQSALDEVFGENIGCEHQEFSSEFDCTGIFKKK